MKWAALFQPVLIATTLIHLFKTPILASDQEPAGDGPTASLENGLVAHYPLDGNANDVGGLGFNGVVHNGSATSDRFGNPSGAISLQGNPDSYVDLGTPEILKFKGDFTVTAWINFSGGTINARIVSYGDDWGFTFYTDGISASRPIGLAIGVQYFTTVSKLSANQWHFVAIERSGNTVRIYANGEFMLNGTLTVEPTYNQHLSFGRKESSRDGCWGGSLDEIRLYNRALSESELDALYSMQPFITRQPMNQVGYWGKSVSFRVEGCCDLPLNYQWEKNGEQIEGATSDSLLLTNLQAADAGTYTVVVSNPHGSTRSDPATLLVNPAGVSIALHTALTIDGVVGLTYGIQYTSDLSDSNSWQGLANITLTRPTQQWFDIQPANEVQRYYQVVPGPIPVP